jgi:hypothetical protein
MEKGAGVVDAGVEDAARKRGSDRIQAGGAAEYVSHESEALVVPLHVLRVGPTADLGPGG